MPRLAIVVASTRPSRKGPAVARWFHDVAKAHGGFDCELVDLAEVGLPLFDEPEHPRLRRYQHEHTRRWSEIVLRADAFALVTPEYNYATPPPLVNALDYLLHEWAYAPVGLVSYGGVSAGLRAAQMTKQIVTALRMMPIPDGVSLPAFVKHIGDDGVFAPGEAADKSATAMLEELVRWTQALAGLRGEARARLAG
jgi:NAD(P)H-dependent FMN reductase